MIYHDEKLGFELRKAFDKAEKRIWIAVPFIGSWESVQRLTGIDWLQNSKIDVRLITDINDNDIIDKQTYDVFKQKGEIRTLLGLHAKLYIIDDFTLLTSANLTETAFSKRHEIGIELKTDNQILSIFESWWEISSLIDDSWKPITKPRNSNVEDSEARSVQALKKLWDLPSKPIVTKSYRKDVYSTNQRNIQTIQGIVRGLGLGEKNTYKDGIERFSIDLYLTNYSDLLLENGVRRTFKFRINDQILNCGIRYTYGAGDGAWICPDLYDDYKKKYRLVDILLENNFKKNEKVELMYNSLTNELTIVKKFNN